MKKHKKIKNGKCAYIYIHMCDKCKYLFGKKLSLNVTGSEERRVWEEASTRWEPVFEP